MNAQQHPQTGTKHDIQKPQPALVLHSMSRAIQAVVGVATFGAGKYSPDNWLLVPDAINRYSNAKQRHMLLGATESHDEESGLLHAAHEAWNALAVLELMLRDAPAAPTEWDESRIDVIGQNGNDGAHYAETDRPPAQVGNYLPEQGGYLIGFIDGYGIVMSETVFGGVGYDEALKAVSDFNAHASAEEFSDWRVPTKDELNLAWVNRDKLGGLSMSGGVYWSATEYTFTIACCQDFIDGSQRFSTKNLSCRVRPVRSVPVSEL